MRKLIFFLTVALAVAWLVTTNSGLNAALKVAGAFSPVELRYQEAKGTIIGQPITLTAVIITKDNHTLTIESFVVDWQLGILHALNIKGMENFLPANQILITGKLSQLSRLEGRVESKSGVKVYSVKMYGTWQEETLTTDIQAMRSKNNWLINSALVKIGQNIITATAKENDSYNWQVDFKEPQKLFNDINGKIYAQGKISGLNSKEPTISAKISSNNLKLDIQGTLKHHLIHSAAKYEHYTFNVSATGSMVKNVWQSNDLLISSQGESLGGNALYDLNKNNGKINLKGKLFAIDTLLKVALYKDKLDGNVELATNDISVLMKFIPDMTRLKGNFEAKAKISGTTNNPIFNAQAHLTDITATFPGMGIKIKPMEVHVKTDKSGKFIIDGKGKMRRGTGDFTIKGFVEPFKEKMPNNIKLVGKNIEFINNQFAHLTASNELDFHYDHTFNRLDINGYVEIEHGNIYFDTRTNSTTKSQDIVFVGAKSSHKELQINPTVNLRILEATHFTGFNLDADISGKLEIAQRNGAIYALGRVTIKEGTYKLPGQKLGVHKGRLLYPPGTLLANPSLDIKMAGNKKEDLDLVIQGTAQKPIIRDSSIAENKDKALSQIITASGGMITDSMDKKGKFRMPELGIASREEYNNNFFDDPSKGKSNLRNKDLVVGMPIGKRLHLQYLQGLSEMNMKGTTEGPSKRIRLKYSLHKNWNLGIETGDQGQGIDLGFAFER